MKLSSESLLAELASAPKPHEASEFVRDRAAQVLRPPGALRRLDELAAWVASWQADREPEIERPVIIVFAGDHGVVSEGVSAFDSEVNAEMMKAFERQKASISAISRVVGAEVHAVDVGVGRPTGNLRREPALSEQRLTEAFSAGRNAVEQHPADLLVLGEMGIGNTTSAAALCAALTLGDHERTAAAVSAFVGVGTGIDRLALENKVAVVVDAVDRVANIGDPIELLTHLGGSELAAICGAIFEARLRGTPVLLDGYIATAPALVLHSIEPDMLAHARAGHRSAEPGHDVVLSRLGLEPLLDLDMRLGEASGAAAAIPLVVMACRLVVEVPTFDEWLSAKPDES